MLLRALVLSAALAPAPVLAQAGPPPVAVGPEVDIHTPGGKEAAPAPRPQGRPLRLGVVPSLGGGADVESEKLAQYLARQLGAKVQPELFGNHDAEADALVSGRIDFAWMPPLQAFNAVLGGAQLLSKLVRNGASTYRSVFFVRADSKAKSLQDLQGATVGWVEANSATGHLFPLAMLAREHLAPSKLFKAEKYLGSHDAVCKAVWSRQVDVGATLANEPPADGKIRIDGCVHSLGADAGKLRVIAVSEPVPNDVIAVRKGLDPAITDKLRKLVMDLPHSAEGKAVLKHILKADGVTAYQQGDFDPVERALEAAAGVESK